MKTEKEIVTESLERAREDLIRATLMEQFYQRKEITGDKNARVGLMQATSTKKANTELIAFFEDQLNSLNAAAN